MEITRRQRIKNRCKQWGAVIGAVLGALSALIALTEPGGLLVAPITFVLWLGIGAGIGWFVGWIVANVSAAESDAS